METRWSRNINLWQKSHKRYDFVDFIAKNHMMRLPQAFCLENSGKDPNEMST